ncbi:MAG: glycerol-3-phosphate 1-O-acyltransferase PlsY [Bacteroidales bacterium]|jgi:glycerol-3-phosphate acyltransferase PlsY|nr:glycerol-3-phosphate 1-O-acyltransferase PlsY [Bacteroidales bacterium]MCU0408865.1 glycerol-3-phosphate 1-O-acyltransferase PlsY [Bacteroidales bacterium]
MNTTSLYAPLTLAYFIGSVPTAVWAGKLFHKIDIREHGSRNAGATNTVRVLGWKTGIPVLVIDLAKGWLAAMLPVFFGMAERDSSRLVNLQIFAGVLAVLGHIYPLFAGFRGGKGVATVFGVLLALHPLLTVSCLGVFLAVVLPTGIVSIASISAGLAFPLLLFLVFDTPSDVFRIFSVIVALALVYTHRQNIRRLLKGEEKKLFTLGRKATGEKS